MKFCKLVFYCSLFLLQTTVYAQKTAEFGGFAGVSTYMGDLNPSNPMNRPAPSLAGFYQFNFNKRYSLKLQGAYGQLRGDGKDLSTSFSPLTNRKFSRNFLDFSTQFVFHFLPFELNTNVRHNFSPYIGAGVAVVYLPSSERAVNFCFPFTFGVKKMIGDRFTIGVEWSMRKLFNDKLDGVDSDLKIFKNSLIHNNDWCAFTGIFISCRVFQEKRKCPVYLND